MACHIVILPGIGVLLAVLISRRLEARLVQFLLTEPPSLRDIVGMMALSRAVIKYVPAIRQHILCENRGRKKGCGPRRRLRTPPDKLDRSLPLLGHRWGL